MLLQSLIDTDCDAYHNGWNRRLCFSSLQSSIINHNCSRRTTSSNHDKLYAEPMISYYCATVIIERSSLINHAALWLRDHHRQLSLTNAFSFCSICFASRMQNMATICYVPHRSLDRFSGDGATSCLLILLQKLILLWLLIHSCCSLFFLPARNDTLSDCVESLSSVASHHSPTSGSRSTVYLLPLKRSSR